MSRKLSKKAIDSFQKMIHSWWPAHRRDLPWRHTRDPYRIMVSEVMLQQTQVSRVLAGYLDFMEAFPSVQALAKATPAQVLRIWKGMGYNRRALYLQRAAKIIVERFHNQLPISEQQLTTLPGLGIYTARAILVFAYEQEVPLVDTNIRQIITHFFFYDQPQKPSAIENIARQLIPPGKSWAWHQALMDYGALELQKGTGKRNKVKKKQIPFRESNRFFRGRIVDRLREGGIGEDQMMKDFVKQYGKSESFFQSILHGLETEGLITRSKADIISLPE